MKKLLVVLRVGEFSERDLYDIAYLLPASVLAAALCAKSSSETFIRAGTPEQKADVVVRLLFAWSLNPEWRFGQLVANLCRNSESENPCGCDPFYVEDGVLAESADALAGVMTLRALRKPPA